MSGIGAQEAEHLLHAARLAAKNAYAPYSCFPVGAALLTRENEVVCGVNVENVSYGLTICAERSAIAKAVSEGKRHFKAIAVWAERCQNGAVTPCGACRQTLAEFFEPEALVILGDPETGGFRQLTMRALLPEAFGPGFVRDGSFQDTNNSIPGG